MKEGNKNIEEAGNTKKGIRWALWLYGFMALCGRFKNIFIVLKLRFIQNIQRKRNYFVQINFAEKNYLFTTASGNLLRRWATAKAKSGKLANRSLLFSAFELFTTSSLARTGVKFGI